MNRLRTLLADPEAWRSNTTWCLLKRYPGLADGVGNHSSQIHPDWRERLRAVILHLQSENRLGVVISKSFLHLARSRGVEIPEETVGDQLRGVLGLAVDRDTKEGFLVPIRAVREEPGNWKADPGLPFGEECGGIRSLLGRLGDSLGTPESFLVAARNSFQLKGGLSLSVSGGSMDIAALLAIIRSMLPTGCRAAGLLDNCVSLVQPQPEPGEKLVRVDFEREKMQGFARECDRGTLLVAHPESVFAREYGNLFQEVWLVECLGELAERLNNNGLLAGLLDSTPLSKQDVLAVKLEAGRLSRKMDNSRVARLFRAAVTLGTGPGVPPHLTASLHGKLSACLRHQGNFMDALNACSAAENAGNRWATHEQKLLVACERAWCLADGHWFREASAILDECANHVDRDPGAFTPAAMRNLWNTRGRILALCGAPRNSWEGCFARTLELQKEWDPGSMGRTRVYLAKALGHAGFHGEAHQVLSEAQASGEMWSTWTGRCLKALEDRSKGRVTSYEPGWESSDLGTADLLRGFLFLFLAGQPSRDSQSVAILLGYAERVFLGGKGPDSPRPGLPGFLGALCRLARIGLGTKEEPFPWLDDFRKEVTGSPGWGGVRNHYGPGVDLLDPDHGADAVLELIRKVPLL